MDQLLVNMRVMNWIERDMHALTEYCELVHKHCGAPLPFNYPVMGHDAFRTSTGVHASAIVKAQEKGAEWLANRVYSGVPSDWFGRGQLIEIGPMSGKSNVVHWLKHHDVAVTDELVSGLLEHAKRAKAVLTAAEIQDYITSTAGAGRKPNA